MKFVKGMIIGSIISASATMMYVEKTSMNKKKMIKRGKQIAKKMGII